MRCRYDNEGRSASAVASRLECGSFTPLCEVDVVTPLGCGGLTSLTCNRRDAFPPLGHALTTCDRNDTTGLRPGGNVNGAMKEGSRGGISDLIGPAWSASRAPVASDA
jgi:hypothetical protein